MTTTRQGEGGREKIASLGIPLRMNWKIDGKERSISFERCTLLTLCSWRRGCVGGGLRSKIPAKNILTPQIWFHLETAEVRVLRGVHFARVRTTY